MVRKHFTVIDNMMLDILSNPKSSNLSSDESSSIFSQAAKKYHMAKILGLFETSQILGVSYRFPNSDYTTNKKHG